MFNTNFSNISAISWCVRNWTKFSKNWFCL